MTLGEGLASTTALVTDVTPDILTFFLGLAGAILVIILLKTGIVMAINWIRRAFRR